MSKKPYFLFLLFFGILFTFSNSKAQNTLHGVIQNEQGEAIPFATVSLQQNQNKAKAKQADSLGEFTFQRVNGSSINLSVYALGFNQQQLHFQFNRDSTIHITLQPLSQDLKGLTITGLRPSIQRKADRVVFDVSKSIQAAGSDGLNLLNTIPGLHTNNNTISLAGKGDMGIMVDGRLVQLSEKLLTNYLRSLSADQIDQIEVITQPGANYDAEGNAGLINIVTSKNKKAGWSGTLTGSIQRFFYKNQPDYKGIKNYGDLDGGLSLNYNNGKWSIYSNADYTTGRELWGYGIGVHYPNQFWDMGDTGEYRIATFNLMAGADYRLGENTTIGGEYTYFYHLEEGADYVNIPIYNNQGALDSSIKTHATYFPIAKSNSFNLHLKQQLNASGAEMILNADYLNFYRHDWSDLTTKSYTPGGKLKTGTTEKLFDTTLQNIKIYTFKADFRIPTSFAQYSFGGKLSFINNYSNIFYFYNNDSLVYEKDLSNEFRYIENTQALYAQASKNLSRWKFGAGLRAEFTQTKAISYFEDSEVKQNHLRLFPSLTATYLPDENQTFTLSYNKRIHRPTFWNLNPYKTFMTAYTYVEGNPYLEPEYVSNLELSHDFKKKLHTSFYFKAIDNGFAQVIVPQDTGIYTHVTQMKNFIKSYRYGISEAVTLQPFSWWETHNLLSGYYTKVHSNIDYIDGIHGWGGYVETNNTFYFNRDKTLSGFVGFWYQFPEIDHFGLSNAYYSVDLGMQLLTLKKRLAVSLNFSDLFQSSANAVTSTVKNIKTTYTNFQLNSNIRLSAVWHFGKEDLKKTTNKTGNQEEKSRIN